MTEEESNDLRLAHGPPGIWVVRCWVERRRSVGVGERREEGGSCGWGRALGRGFRLTAGSRATWAAGSRVTNRVLDSRLSLVMGRMEGIETWIVPWSVVGRLSCFTWAIGPCWLQGVCWPRVERGMGPPRQSRGVQRGARSPGWGDRKRIWWKGRKGRGPDRRSGAPVGWSRRGRR